MEADAQIPERLRTWDFVWQPQETLCSITPKDSLHHIRTFGAQKREHRIEPEMGAAASPVRMSNESFNTRVRLQLLHDMVVEGFDKPLAQTTTDVFCCNGWQLSVMRSPSTEWVWRDLRPEDLSARITAAASSTAAPTSVL